MDTTTYTAFAGEKLLISAADLGAMLARVKTAADKGKAVPILVFEDDTGKQVDFDLRGTLEEVKARAAPEDKAGPGRPKLGVVSREVTLLPRHWEWLERQSFGISGSLRRLVEQAMKHEPDVEKARLAREAVAKVMWVMAGNLPGFEEASRALYAGDDKRWKKLVKGWPKDIKAHLTARLATTRPD
jgi:hypothetical protein